MSWTYQPDDVITDKYGFRYTVLNIQIYRNDFCYFIMDQFGLTFRWPKESCESETIPSWVTKARLQFEDELKELLET